MQVGTKVIVHTGPYVGQQGTVIAIGLGHDPRVVVQLVDGRVVLLTQRDVLAAAHDDEEACAS